MTINRNYKTIKCNIGRHCIPYLLCNYYLSVDNNRTSVHLDVFEHLAIVLESDCFAFVDCKLHHCSHVSSMSL